MDEKTEEKKVIETKPDPNKTDLGTREDPHSNS